MSVHVSPVNCEKLLINDYIYIMSSELRNLFLKQNYKTEKDAQNIFYIWFIQE
jgi:hypothetical protein